MNIFQRIFSPKILEPGTDLNRVRRICIGTTTDSLTEALYMTALPASIKTRFPHLTVQVYSAHMNPVVFAGNPSVDSYSVFPKAVYGKRQPQSLAHPIQGLEQGLGLSIDTAPTPQLYLTAHEKTWARDFLISKRLPAHADKPLCVIHPWRKKHRRTAQLLPVEVWDSFVAELSLRYRVWQVGMWDQPALKGCEYYFLSSGGKWEARDLFALMSHAKMFVGLASAPMHVAHALKTPSITLIGNESDAGLYKDGFAISVKDQSTVELLESLRAGINLPR